MAGDLDRTRRMLKLLVKGITLTPIPGERWGEDIAVSLRDDGWPAFWRIVWANRKR